MKFQSNLIMLNLKLGNILWPNGWMESNGECPHTSMIKTQKLLEKIDTWSCHPRFLLWILREFEENEYGLDLGISENERVLVDLRIER